MPTRRRRIPVIEVSREAVTVDGTAYAITFVPADQQGIEGLDNAYRVATLTNSRGKRAGEVLGYRTEGGYRLFVHTSGKLGQLHTDEWDRVAGIVGHYTEHTAPQAS